MEFATYRWREHCGPNYDNDLGYRTMEEFEVWKNRDPIARYQDELLRCGILSISEIATMEKSIADEVRLAFAFAESSAFPDPGEAFTDLVGEPQHVPIRTLR